jgi:hypothetical protein
VRNHGLAARRALVRWSIDGAETSSAWLDLPAAGAATARLDRTVPAQSVVTATVDDEAGYRADNSRHFVTDPPRPLPVFLVSGMDGPAEAGMYVRAALEAAGGDGRRFEVTALRADDKRLTDAAALEPAQVIVIVGTRGLDHAARAAVSALVRRGRGLLVAAGPETEPGVIRELLGEAGRGLSETAAAQAIAGSLAATEARHPVLSALGETTANLGQVRVERAWLIDDLAGATTLVRLANGRTAVAELTLGAGRVFVLTSDLGRRWNTWPLHPTFVPFVVETMRHLSDERWRAREALIGSVPGGAADHPGVVTLAGGDRIAVNVDPRESRIASIPVEGFLARIEHLAPAGAPQSTQESTEGAQALWRYGVVVLLLLLGFEGLIAARPGRAGAAGPALQEPIPGGEPS